MNAVKKSILLAKILLNYKKRKDALDTMPIRLWIESSLACNLACVMCPNKDIPNNKKGIMNFDLYKKIIDEACLFGADINIHHRGEPFINKDIFKMITYAKAKKLNVRFHSNGTLLDPEKIGRLLDSAPDLLSISFDCFQKELYEEVRVNANFEKTFNNICTLLEMKKKRGLKKPYIVIERIDFKRYRNKLNAREVQRVEDAFRRLDVDELIFKEEYDWSTVMSPEKVRYAKHSVCAFPWYAMVICYDGTVTPCPQDYMAAISLGNLKEKSIREIWNDAPYKQLRKGLVDNIDSLALCRKCDRLCRKQVGGLPFQYMLTFLIDQFIGYGKLRKILGTAERN